MEYLIGDHFGSKLVIIIIETPIRSDSRRSEIKFFFPALLHPIKKLCMGRLETMRESVQSPIPSHVRFMNYLNSPEDYKPKKISNTLFPNPEYLDDFRMTYGQVFRNASHQLFQKKDYTIELREYNQHTHGAGTALEAMCRYVKYMILSDSFCE